MFSNTYDPNGNLNVNVQVGGGGGGGSNVTIVGQTLTLTVEDVADGIIGSPTVADAMQIGFKDGSGHTQIPSAANPLPVTIPGTTVNAGDLYVNIDQVGGNPISGGVPVVIGIGSASFPVASANSIVTGFTTWTPATAVNSFVDFNSASVVPQGNAITVYMSAAGTITGGVITFECSYDNITFFPVLARAANSFTSGTTYTVLTGVTVAYLFNSQGAPFVRARLSSALTGTGNFVIELACYYSSATQVVATSIAGIVSENLVQVNGTGVSVLGGTGTQIVSIAGHTGASFDAVGQNATGATAEIIVGGQFNTTPTTITTGHFSPLQLDASGNLLVNISANTFGTITVTGTVAATQSGNWTTRIVGNAGAIFDVAQNVAAPANELVVGGVYNSSPPTLSPGNASQLQLTSTGALQVSLGSVTLVVAGALSNGGAPSTANLGVLPALVNTAAPTYSNNTQVFLSSTLTGACRVAVTGNAGATLDSTIGAATAPTNAIAISGVFQSTPPALTAGQAVARQVDTTGSLMINAEGRKGTYRIGITGFTPVASATSPSVSIQGSGTTTVRVTRVNISITDATGSTTAANLILQRFSVLSGGTTGSTPTLAKNDTNDAAGTAVVLQYSAVPTTATAVGGITAVQKYPLVTNSATVVSTIPIAEFDFGNFPGAQSFVLRGTSDYLGIIFTAVGTTPSADLWIEWTEE